MEKLKRKPLTSPESMKADGWGVVYGGKDFWKRYVLSFEWKKVGVMNVESGDDG